VEGVKQRGRSLRQVVDATVDILAFTKIMARMMGLVGKRFKSTAPRTSKARWMTSWVLPRWDAQAGAKLEGTVFSNSGMSLERPEIGDAQRVDPL
jgi:hypothetical protein